MRKRYLILLAGLGVFMTFFLNACSLAEKAAETVSEDKMFIMEQQSEYENRAARRARQYKRKK